VPPISGFLWRLHPLPRNLIAWSCLISILGYGRLFLQTPNGFLKYAGEASYPLYILHQTVIIALALFVVRWSSGVLPKFIVIAIGSLVISAIIYDLLIRRWNVVRFLFGMKPKA
jgi:peptidoglycan/LPS O-acetylase OafA/YrhL